MNILVSGASGFVGQALCVFLKNAGHSVTKVDRHSHDFNDQHNTQYHCLISLAGRAHVMHETAENVYQAYAEINIDYTLKMAQLAKKLDIKRFIFLSSIKVNGEHSDKPFTTHQLPMPADAYGKSKLAAEIAVQNFCEENGLEWVVIRPPLVYGRGVKANIKSLIGLCQKPIPLPFALVHNKRSLISLENLCSFIALCCHHPQAANQTFLISDDEDVSTAQLIRTIRLCLGRQPLLFGVPTWVLKACFRLLGKTHYSERLLGNLQVDISKAKTLLGWRPVIGFEAGMRQTVEAYLD